MSFERDGEKARANLENHGVSFEEAKTVLADPLYVDFMTQIIPLMSIDIF